MQWTTLSENIKEKVKNGQMEMVFEYQLGKLYSTVNTKILHDILQIIFFSVLHHCL